MCKRCQLSQKQCLSRPPQLLSRCLPQLHMEGGGNRGKGSWDICQLPSLIKELMRFTLCLLSREPIPSLTEGGGYVLAFLSAEPTRLEILYQAKANVLSGICWFVFIIKVFFLAVNTKNRVFSNEGIKFCEDIFNVKSLSI